MRSLKTRPFAGQWFFGPSSSTSTSEGFLFGLIQSDDGEHFFVGELGLDIVDVPFVIETLERFRSGFEEDEVAPSRNELSRVGRRGFWGEGEVEVVARRCAAEPRLRSRERPPVKRRGRTSPRRTSRCALLDAVRPSPATRATSRVNSSDLRCQAHGLARVRGAARAEPDRVKPSPQRRLRRSLTWRELSPTVTSSSLRR